MEVTELLEALELEQNADVGVVRRRCQLLAAEMGLSETRAADAALVATELATNVIKHAQHGGALVGTVRAADHKGLAVLAWDRGPGMNVDACLRDGVSTAGTAGAGLGAIARIASRWDAYSQPGKGSVVLAQVLAHNAVAAPPRLEVAALAVPYPGERQCGDGWDVHERDDLVTVLVCDGLGHGDGAAEASAAVIAAFRSAPDDELSLILDRAHHAARPTRGAACTLVRVDRAARTATIAGVGNVQAWTYADSLRPLVTQHGTLGQVMPRLREEQYAFPPGALLIVHSDGLKSRLAIDGPALRGQSAATIASVAWRDCTRGRDDATVVVLKEAP